MIGHILSLFTLAALTVSAEQSRSGFVENEVDLLWANRDQTGTQNDIAICYHGPYTITKPKQVVHYSNPTYTKSCAWYRPWGCKTKHFDCFFMSGPNQVFTAHGDANDENLGFKDDGSGKCKFDAGWKTITC